MRQDNPKAASAQDWLAGGGEMGKVVRAMDWSKTPLGPIESWPQSLRTTVSLCLASNFPISIAWGPGRTQIYNDGYWPICGDKHPQAMGMDYRECWASAWPAIGGAHDQASAGQTAFLENQRMFLDRYGYLEETFFTFSFSPIRDESGGVGGLFHPVTELTQQTLAERRLKVLRDLAERASDAKTVDEACRQVAATLADCALDLPFALVYLADGEGLEARLAGGSGLAHGTPWSPERIDLHGPEGWPLAEAARAGRGEFVEKLTERFGPLACGPYPEPPPSAFVAPIRFAGLEHPLGWLVAGTSSRRPLDEPYRNFYVMLLEAVSTCLLNARAYEEERKRAEALAEIDRAKTAFFSNVSHEFRTPLALMLGPVEDALGDASDPLAPAQRERLQTAHRNSLRLLKLVNTLLDFSRIEAGRVQAAYEPVDLARVTAELASNFRAACEKAGLSLVIDCPPLAEPVYVDREMWEKIVLNLLSNAFKFTFEGSITVLVREAGGVAELRVIDTGTGIPEGELPRLFERFYRVQGARGRTFEGTGIGLALVQELVKLHRGSVHAESVAGKGSTFSVSVPLGRAHLPADRIGAARTLASTALGADPYVEEALRWLPGEDVLPAPAPAEVEAPARRARVLWADDNADMREYVRRLLAGAYEVEAVADGEAALAAALARRPDLVLSDVMMPRMDGFELLRRLRADPRTASVPVILLSARAGEESRVEGLEHGADDYLIKPFSARELLARVRAHVGMAQLREAAEVSLREADRRKDEFIAMLAHELRNPLSAIALNSAILNRARLADERAGNAVAAIGRQIGKLQRLCDDLLDVARAAYGKLVLEKVPLDLLEAARSVVEDFARRHGGRVGVQIDGVSAWVVGDAARLSQMIENLLDNAMKYGGKSIRVAVAAEGERASVTVADDGEGIAADLLPMLFQPFVQGSRSLERAQGGLGLGLALVERLAGLHGGTLEAASEGLGRGAAFTIRLPLARAPAARGAPAPAPGSGQRRRVLVIEDEVDSRAALGQLLGMEGHEVAVADNGNDGLAQLEAFRPDVAVIDLGLPGLDGFEVARRARAAVNGRIRLIAVTGYGRDEDRRRSREAGFDLHLTKPLAYEDLLRALDG